MCQALRSDENDSPAILEAKEKYITKVSQFLSESITFFRKESQSINLNVDNMKQSQTKSRSFLHRKPAADEFNAVGQLVKNRKAR
jgi:hypothetical protein